VDSGKAGDPMYKFGKQSSSFDPSSQTEDIGNSSMKASSYGKNLEYVAAYLSEWTSDVTNNYEDLSELYDELLSVWSRYRTCRYKWVVFRDIKSLIKRSCL
jgi:hypothetical protein